MSASPPSHLALGDGAEFDAIRAMLDVWGAAARAIGDDAAVVDVPVGEQLVVSTDASVEGVHFRREWMSAEEIGARATAAALSDLAAMAAHPIGLLLALGMPESWQAQVTDLARGVGAMAAQHGCPIVGGNVTRAGELSLTITVLGATSRPLRRNAARDGDAVYVTGRLGGSAAALRALLSARVPDAEQLARFVAPVPRLREAEWLAAAGAHAAIDISDGLLADAAHLARASGLSLSLDANVLPCFPGVSADEAATSGEEYELLVTLPVGAPVDTAAFSSRFGIPLTAIGEVRVAGHQPVHLTGKRVARPRGHDHLS